MFTTTTTAAAASVLLLLLAVGARAQSDSPQFPQWSDRWTLVFRHFSSIDGDAVYCECTRVALLINVLRVRRGGSTCLCWCCMRAHES